MTEYYQWEMTGLKEQTEPTEGYHQLQIERAETVDGDKLDVFFSSFTDGSYFRCRYFLKNRFGGFDDRTVATLLAIKRSMLDEEEFAKAPSGPLAPPNMVGGVLGGYVEYRTNQKTGKSYPNINEYFPAAEFEARVAAQAGAQE